MMSLKILIILKHEDNMIEEPEEPFDERIKSRSTRLSCSITRDKHSSRREPYFVRKLDVICTHVCVHVCARVHVSTYVCETFYGHVMHTAKILSRIMP